MSLYTFRTGLPAGRYKAFPITVTLSLTIVMVRLGHGNAGRYHHRRGAGAARHC
jgi:hypothetical protein